MRGRWRGDPGPCPVDDAPHTTCTSPDYHGTRGVLVVPVRRPRVLDQAPVALVTETVSTDISTKTYRGRRPRIRKPTR